MLHVKKYQSNCWISLNEKSITIYADNLQGDTFEENKKYVRYELSNLFNKSEIAQIMPEIESFIYVHSIN